MEGQGNNNYFLNREQTHNHNHNHNQVKYLFESKTELDLCTEMVKKKMEYDCFPKREQPFIGQLCEIIAKVMLLPDSSKVRIKGQEYPAAFVKTVYAGLTAAHLEYVRDNYNRIPYEVKHKVTYIRTALFNSVDELDLEITGLPTAEYELNTRQEKV